MLLLILEAGDARYAVPASRVVEVIPVPVLRPIPGAPAFIPGVFSYHGRIVPVVDLSILLSDRPSRQLLSTRILLVRVQPKVPHVCLGLADVGEEDPPLPTAGRCGAPSRSGSDQPALIGFMAEHATETLACKREEFQPAGVQGSGAPYAGDILIRPDGLIQELDLDRMLTTELHTQLFAEAAVGA